MSGARRHDERNGSGAAKQELAEVRRELTARLPPGERGAAAAKSASELLQMVKLHEQEDTARLVAEAVAEREGIKDALRLKASATHDETVRAVAQRLKRHAEVVKDLRGKVVPTILRAYHDGTVTLHKGTVAHLHELIDEESGAVEVALTDSEIADLLQSGHTYTEVGDGVDVLLRVVDTSGTLPKLRGFYEEYRAQHAAGTGGTGNA